MRIGGWGGVCVVVCACRCVCLYVCMCYGECVLWWGGGGGMCVVVCVCVCVQAVFVFEQFVRSTFD